MTAAWRPTLTELARLLTLVEAGKLNGAHTHYGQWRFWLTDSLTHPHAALCEREGRFYLTRNLSGGRSVEWATRDEVLLALRVEDLDDALPCPKCGNDRADSSIGRYQG